MNVRCEWGRQKKKERLTVKSCHSSSEGVFLLPEVSHRYRRCICLEKKVREGEVANGWKGRETKGTMGTTGGEMCGLRIIAFLCGVLGHYDWTPNTIVCVRAQGYRETFETGDTRTKERLPS